MAAAPVYEKSPEKSHENSPESKNLLEDDISKSKLWFWLRWTFRFITRKAWFRYIFLHEDTLWKMQGVLLSTWELIWSANSIDALTEKKVPEVTRIWAFKLHREMSRILLYVQGGWLCNLSLVITPTEFCLDASTKEPNSGLSISVAWTWAFITVLAPLALSPIFFRILWSRDRCDCWRGSRGVHDAESYGRIVTSAGWHEILSKLILRSFTFMISVGLLARFFSRHALHFYCCAITISRDVRTVLPPHRCGVMRGACLVEKCLPLVSRGVVRASPSKYLAGDLDVYFLSFPVEDLITLTDGASSPFHHSVTGPSSK